MSIFKNAVIEGCHLGYFMALKNILLTKFDFLLSSSIKKTLQLIR